MLRHLLIRLGALFRRDEVEADFDEELRYHLEREIERNLARGMSPQEARREARRGFGYPYTVKEEARETWRWRWLDELAHDLRYALRQLSANPGFAITTVLILALGIGATTMMFGVRRSYAAQERGLASPERLVYVGQGPKGCGGCTNISSGNYLTIRDQTRSLEQVSMLMDWEPVLRREGGAELVDAARVTTELFRILDIRSLLGRTLVPDDSASDRHHTVVLSEAMWATRFAADSSVLGRTIVLDRIPHTIVGVVSNEAAYPSGTELWVPLVLTPEQAVDRTSTRYRVIGRLREGVSVDAAGTEISGVGDRLSAEFPETMSESTLRVAPLLDLSSNQLTGDTAEQIFAAAVGLLLIIGCINLAGLLIARLSARRRELAVRRALGAAPARIARQLVTETLLLTAFAGATGLLLAVRGTSVLFGGGLPLDGHTFGIAVGTGLLTGLGIGIWPAVRFTVPRLLDDLSQGTRLATGSIDSARGRRILVIAQVAMTIVLLAAAGALARSFQNIYDVDAGFSSDRLLAVWLWNALPKPDDETDPAHFDRLVDAIEAIPEVERAGATLGLPFGHGAGRGRFEIDGRPPRDSGQRPTAHMQAATPGYFETLGISILRGRGFSNGDDLHGPRVAVINRELAERFFPDGDPVGRGLIIDDVRWEIVGVVANLFHGNVDELARPEIYRPMQQWSRPRAWIAMRTRGNPMSIGPAVVATVTRFDTDIAVTRMLTMKELRASDMGSERRMLRLMGVFAFAAVLISAIGLYGLISYSVAQRLREFGIRLAIGAQRGAMLRLVLGQGLRLAAIGGGLGILAAVGACA